MDAEILHDIAAATQRLGDIRDWRYVRSRVLDSFHVHGMVDELEFFTSNACAV